MFSSTEGLYHAIFDSAQFSVIATDLQGTIHYCNKYALNLLGYQWDELVHKTTPVLIHDLAEVEARAAELSLELGYPVGGFDAFVAKSRRGEVVEQRWTYISKSGERIPVLLSVSQLCDEQGQPQGFLGVAKDLRELQQLRSFFQESEDRFKRLADAAFEGIMITRNGVISDCNDKMLQMSGYNRAELLGMSPLHLVSEQLRNEVGQRIKSGSEQLYKADLLRKDGQVMQVEVCARHAREQGDRIRITAIRDLTERQELEDQIARQQQALREKNDELRHQAMHDELTRLPNRRAAMSMMVAESRRCRHFGQPFSVLILDIDHFKHYNDDFGHLAGDEALARVAELLAGHVRQSDMVARYGGEEFVCLLPGADASAAFQVAEKLRQVVEGEVWPLRTITLSIGLSTSHSSKEALEVLLKQADDALYQAKRQGRNQVCQAQYQRAG
ncbi:sensor domain-containing diguanylate cyclase [Balneatrix alpica]|uniref:diguanylate cyclase n=1 Tax=Balneatrix alpica TaxID=75684 RepID=A0ABV5ZC56_9GAMM|nr:diguanylate cyclase [Balneatrix alpica]